MSEPDFGASENADDDWPYNPPEHIGYAHQPDSAMPGDDTRPYEEWHHDRALPGEPGGWEAPQELEPPPEWSGGGTFVPGNDARPAWDDLYQDQPAQDDSYEPEPYRPSSHRRSRRSARRSVVVTTLLLAAFAVGAAGALVHNGTIKLSPTANPQASATAGLGTTAGAGHGSTGSHSGAEQPPAITRADAEKVVSHYLQVNNEANESYSDSLLATIESGSSYTMDAGSYRFALGESDRTPYVPFELTRTSDYIPRLAQNTYPRWFVVQGSYVTMAGGKNLGSAYIVFAQDSAGAAWKDVVEPDILPGQALPQIATDSAGYAESVAADGTRLNVAPDKIGEVTAAWLNRVASSTSNTVIKDEAGNLADLDDEVFWRSGEGGPALDATDTHSVPADPVFALKTTTGGALVFYTTAAKLTLTPPDGGTISSLTIPGYYSPSSSSGLTSATVGYMEQFATYIPPAGNSDRDVVADISSIASRG
jgi:hypothetical protein